MVRWGWRCAVAIALVGCGRFGFSQRGTGDGGAGDDAADSSIDAPADAAIDTPVGATCTIDPDCGRCARCDNTGHCAIEPITELFLGHRATCYIGANGDRWCAGENNNGQLGLGDTTNRLAPERANDGGNWSSIRNSYYGYAIAERAGQWYRWGSGTLTPASWMPSHAMREMLGDVNNLCFWENDGTSNCPGASGTWTSLAVGGDHSCGVRTDGSLYCWGTNRSNALGDAAFTEEQVVAAPNRVGTSNDWVTVAAGGKGIATANGGKAMTCATKTNGKIYCWGHRILTGTNNVDVGVTPTAVSPDTDWTWIDLDWEHACAGKADGSVWCWGTDSYGGYIVPGQTQALVPTRISGTYSRWLMGGHHACGLVGSRWKCFGLNAHGELGIGTSTSTGQFVDLCP